jgi:hypothetical protein
MGMFNQYGNASAQVLAGGPRPLTGAGTYNALANPYPGWDLKTNAPVAGGIYDPKTPTGPLTPGGSSTFQRPFGQPIQHTTTAINPHTGQPWLIPGQQQQPQTTNLITGPTQQQPSTGSGAASPGFPGIGSLTTSVQPQSIFNPAQTQWGVNQALATAAQQADPRFQQKQFMSPGRSLDTGTLGAAIPGIAQALSQGQQAAAAIPLQDAFANQNNLLQGQLGQQQQYNGLANALAQFGENNIYQQNAVLGPLLGMLGNQFMGF